MKQCLVVDDSRVIRTVAKRILESLNFETDEAEDGMAGLRACREKMPDLILLDWSMPSMTGVEFVRSIRRQEGGARPAILFCVTENDADRVAEAMEAGADEFLVKPFSSATVKAMLVSMGVMAA